MERIRASRRVFASVASVSTRETYDPSVLCLVREYEGEFLIALFNFSSEGKTAWINEEGLYKDLLSGETIQAKGVLMPPCGIRWMLRTED